MLKITREHSLFTRLKKDIDDKGYASHSWQYIKRMLAEPLIQCVVETIKMCIGDCIEAIYLADLTGGEHSYITGHGGKDLDVIIYSPNCQEMDKRVEKELENALEEAARIIISEVFGFDPIEKLGIPNVVEIHIVRSRDDAPYWNMIFSRFSRLIKVWDKDAGFISS